MADIAYTGVMPQVVEEILLKNKAHTFSYAEFLWFQHKDF